MVHRLPTSSAVIRSLCILMDFCGVFAFLTSELIPSLHVIHHLPSSRTKAFQRMLEVLLDCPLDYWNYWGGSKLVHDIPLLHMVHHLPSSITMPFHRIYEVFLVSLLGFWVHWGGSICWFQKFQHSTHYLPSTFLFFSSYLALLDVSIANWGIGIRHVFDTS